MSLNKVTEVNDVNMNDVTYIVHEKQIQEYWNGLDCKSDVYSMMLRKVENKNNFVFTDGPPFCSSNSLHMGHILVSFIKDAVLRYLYANGFNCLNKMGFDCHGLPMEMVAYKELKISTNSEVHDMGINVFNKFCKDKVHEFSENWYPIFNRIGRLNDKKNSYKTMDTPFMESVWWVFKQLWDKKLVSREYEIMPYSIKCSTPLSNFEAGSSYKNIQTESIYVLFPLKDRPNINFVAWTTTPWTLPSNVSLCVNPKARYVLLTDTKGLKYVVSENCVTGSKIKYVNKEYFGIGSDLVGMEYIPPFNYLRRDSYKVISADFVITDVESKESNEKRNTKKKVKTDKLDEKDDKKEKKEIEDDLEGSGEQENTASLGFGTGIVHIAPYHGKDDMDACLSNNIITIDEIESCGLVDEEGKYVSIVTEYAGQEVFTANDKIIDDLRKRGLVLRSQMMKHNYPHCPRTDTPLIYKAIRSFFIDVPSIGDNLVNNNEKVRWIPSYVGEKRFHNWIKNPKKWGVSRNRFFGTPINVWISDDGLEMRCFGSIQDVIDAGKDFNDDSVLNKLKTDIHVEFVKDIVIPSLQGKGLLTHSGLVFDCWFESGCVPLAQYHYPFENKDCVDDRTGEGFLTDFVAEGLDQTRGWFYTLMVISTALFNKPAFKTVVCSGLVLDENGVKFSKRYGNFKEPLQLLNKHGADIMRLYLLSSCAVRAEPLLFTETFIEQMKQRTIPWINAVKLFIEHKINFLKKKTGSVFDGFAYMRTNNVTDLWILSRIGSLINDVRFKMDEFNLDSAVKNCIDFIEDLTNWYVKFNRDRLKGLVCNEEWIVSLSVLHRVLFTYAKVMTPFTPFLSEYMYSFLKSECMPEDQLYSIHLCKYPTNTDFPHDVSVLNEFKRMQQLVYFVRKLRMKTKKATSIRVPLKRMLAVHCDPEFLESVKKLEPLIKEELNILTFEYKLENEFVSFKLIPNNKTIGQTFKTNASQIKNQLLLQPIEKLREHFMDPCSTFTVLIDNKHIDIGAEFLTIEKTVVMDKDGPNTLTETEDGLTISLDTTYDEEIESLYTVRMFFSHVQNMRKDALLRPWNTIRLFVTNTESKLLHSIVSNKDKFESKMKCVVECCNDSELVKVRNELNTFNSCFTLESSNVNNQIDITIGWKKQLNRSIDYTFFTE